MIKPRKGLFHVCFSLSVLNTLKNVLERVYEFIS
nr:MAG TPA: hypothetical protein [Caudoviricetes sp.]